MSTKALKTQLLAAVAMVLVASVALGSSTYAWFASNTRVTAEGMEVSAQSDAVFLQIKNKGAQDTAYSTTANASLNTDLYPVSHSEKDLKTKNDVTTVSNWWYGYSNNAANSALSGTKTYLSEGTDLTKYVASAEYTLSITEASGKNEATNLVVSSITITEKDTKLDGVCVVVAGPAGVVEFDATNADGNRNVSLADAVGKVSKNKTVDVTVYIYIDGENEYVTTNNIANLGGSVALTFDVTA